jgi:hypothetical protein
LRPRSARSDRSNPRLLGAAAFPLLLLLLCGAGQIALCGCGGAIMGPRQLVPDPRWLQAGKEMEDGFLISRLEGAEIKVKYLGVGELLQLLNANSDDPPAFTAGSAELEGLTPFLLQISNQGPAPLILEVQHAQLEGNRGDRLYSLEYTDIYEIFSEDRDADRKMRILARLLLPSSPLLPGESRQGLLLFGPLDAKAKGAVLRFSFLAAGKPLKSHVCIFPFAVEPLRPTPGGTGSGGRS